jgi:hypothetical protein
VYDKIEENKTAEADKKKEVDRKPKYISNLLKSAEIRKKEYERLVERKVSARNLKLLSRAELFCCFDKFVTKFTKKFKIFINKYRIVPIIRSVCVG